MPVPNAVHDQVVAERDALLQENVQLQEERDLAVSRFVEIRQERNELRNERKMEIMRAAMRRFFDLISDMENPPPPGALGTRIGNFVDNLYDAMYN